MRIRTEAEWRGIIGTWERSGNSVTDFCKTNKVASSGFYKWLKVVRGNHAEGKSPVKARTEVVVPQQEFIAIDVPNLSGTDTRARIYITTSYGARLEIPL